MLPIDNINPNYQDAVKLPEKDTNYKENITDDTSNMAKKFDFNAGDQDAVTLTSAKAATKVGL